MITFFGLSISKAEVEGKKENTFFSIANQGMKKQKKPGKISLRIKKFR